MQNHTTLHDLWQQFINSNSDIERYDTLQQLEEAIETALEDLHPQVRDILSERRFKAELDSGLIAYRIRVAKPADNPFSLGRDVVYSTWREFPVSEVAHARTEIEAWLNENWPEHWRHRYEAKHGFHHYEYEIIDGYGGGFKALSVFEIYAEREAQS